jgi:hypothetical protein
MTQGFRGFTRRHQPHVVSTICVYPTLIPYSTLPNFDAMCILQLLQGRQVTQEPTDMMDGY